MTNAKIKEALELAGNQHKFQKLLVLFIGLTWIEINFVLLGSTLIYMDPIFNCNSSGDKRIYESEACPKMTSDSCYMVDNFTITAELSLYCGLQWARDIIQSVFSLGSFMGLVVMSLISDTKGRKFSFIISLVISVFGVFFAFLGGIFQVIPLLLISQFLGGFGAYAIVTLSYTMLSDFCGDKFRSRGVVLVNSAWGLSTMSLGIFYILQINWFYFLLYMTLIPLILMTIVMQKFLYESPFILVHQNKKYQALEVITKIAIINGKQENIPAIRNLVLAQPECSQKTKASFKNVFKILGQWQYFKPIILLTLIYGIGNLNFYGISYSFDSEGLGFGFNSMIAGGVEMFSFLFLNYVVNILPRRKGISGFYALVVLIGFSFLTSFVQDNYVVGTILLGFSRVFSTISYTLIACMQTQAFTVQIQSSAAGFIEAFALYGALLAPLIVDLSDKIGINPVASISICVSFAIWPNIFLKQTLIKEQKQVKNPLLDPLNPQQSQQYQATSSKRIQSTQTLITDGDQISVE